MTIESNLYEKSIKILSDLIGFQTISGQDNSELINYCEKILNSLNIETFKVFDEDKKRVNLEREFFECTVTEAKQIIEKVIKDAR